MSKVSITRSLLDNLATSISVKSGEPVPMTLTEMKDAVDSIQTGGDITVESLSVTSNGTYTAPTGKAYTPVTVSVPTPTPSLQTKTKTYTPTTSQQTETVTADSGYDGLSQVSVSASELVSGSETKTENGTYDVTNLAQLVVNVSGGGGGTSTCATTTMTNSSDTATSIEFTNLSGEPKWFFVRLSSQLTRSSSYSYYYVTSVRYNGTNHNGNYYRRSNGTFYNDTSHYSHSYANKTLTVSSSASRGAAGGSFYNGTYELTYIY